jgi:hypothetical protein
VSAKKTDIPQIGKYLSGELDAKDMHELERQALDDPFLMDALEGYEGNNQNQQANLDALNNQLQQRIAQNKQRSLWPAIAIAASVLLVMTIGGLWLFHDTNSLRQGSGRILSDRVVITKTIRKPRIPVLKNSPPVNVNPTVLKPAHSHHLPVRQQISAGNEVLADQMEKSFSDTSYLGDTRVTKLPVKDSAPKANMLSEVVVIGYGTQKRTSVTGSVSAINPAPLQKSVQGRASGVSIADKVEKSSDSSKVRLIAGQVLSKSDGMPLPGVSVYVLGKNKGVLTDAQGHFSIQATKKDELTFTYIGFKQERVKVKEKDSLKVLLDESQMALAEVVVVPANGQENIKKAHPAAGWESFKRYLKEKAHSPDSKTGTVRLTFIVNPDNSLSNFKITKSLSFIADRQAIELIKQGPSWIHNQNENPELIKINVRF